MTIELLKSKIHRVKVTEANLNYIGSITIDSELVEAAGLYPNEKVQVVNITNGERIETYVIPGERKSRKIVLSFKSENGEPPDFVSVCDSVIGVNISHAVDTSVMMAYIGNRYFHDPKVFAANAAMRGPCHACDKVIMDERQQHSNKRDDFAQEHHAFPSYAVHQH